MDVHVSPETGQRLIQRAYKTELDPSPEQVRAFRNHVGACRFVYNWGLRERIAHYEATGKTLSLTEQNRALTVLKQGECPWLYEVSNAALQNSLRHLDAAYKHFFRRVKAGEEKAGFPRPKRRGAGSFKVNRGVSIEERWLTLPRIGRVRLKEKGYLPVGVGFEPGEPIRMTSTTISERAGRWFASVQVEEHIEEVTAQGPLTAVHLGVRQLATTLEVGQDQETIYGNPTALARYERKLAREQRKLSRKQKGSRNRDKQRLRVATVHARIANLRADVRHQVSRRIVDAAGALIIEDWDVADMLEGHEQGHELAKRVADASMGELRRTIGYKADWSGVEVYETAPGFPSSTRCARCGVVTPDLPFNVVFTCPACGHAEDRERNALDNLLAGAIESSEDLASGGS